MKDDHKKRSEELRKHAIEKGEDSPHDRIWSHRFIFDGDLENEFYSITNVLLDIKLSANPLTFYLSVSFKSNFGRDKLFHLEFHVLNSKFYKNEGVNIIRFKRPGIHGSYFKNEDPRIARKDANELRKFIMEYFEDNGDEIYFSDDEGYLNEYEIDFTVNNLYKS